MKTHQPKPLLLIELLAMVIGVGALDYYAGYELNTRALYAVPVAFATWYFGAVLGVVIAATATGIALWAELATGKVYSAQWIAYANTASPLCVFLFVALSFSYLRRTIDLARKRVQAFTGPLPICASCHRVDGGDAFWMDFPTYIRKNSEAVPEFRTCPICAAARKPAVEPPSLA